MSFLKKLFSKKLHSYDNSFTIEEVSGFISTGSWTLSSNTAKEIMKDQETEDVNEAASLMFALVIAFTAVASVTVSSNPHLSRELKTKIMDKVCDDYIESIRAWENENNLRNIDTEIFVRTEDEKNLCINYFQRVIGYGTDKLPNTNPYALATILFRKRFLEYQTLWEQDEEKMLTQGGFFPLMPGKVYEHWSGKKSTVGAIVFSLILYKYLSRFSLEVSKFLATVTIKE